jgi:hypothetical protein
MEPTFPQLRPDCYREEGESEGPGRFFFETHFRMGPKKHPKNCQAQGEAFGPLLGPRVGGFSGQIGRRTRPPVECSYLVDPASSHMLVSKIKPCMSKYKQLYTVKLRMAH